MINLQTERPVIQSTAFAEMEAFDAMPPRIRAWLRGAAISWSALDMAPHVAGAIAKVGERPAVAWALDRLRETERLEIAEFARAHAARHGYALPSVAAGVPPLREAA